jgi:pilus assembly protein CpaE
VTTAAVKALVALDSGVSREAVQAALPTGTGGIEIVGVVDGIEETWSTLQATPTDLLLVACAGYSDRVLFLIDGSVKDRPDRPVVVLSSGSTNGFVQRAFEAGADDFISLPETSDRVGFALQKAVARKRGALVASGVSQAQLITILGPKGGTGKTLTAVNLAVAMAEAGSRVVAVDLDLQFGDLGLALGLAPDRTLWDLTQSGGSLDSEKLDGYLMSHSSGVRALLAPTRPDQASAVTVEFLREVYAAMRASFDVVIVDTPPGFTPEVIASIDNSSHVCVVGMLDALSLKNTKLGLETLELMGYDPERINLVLNRADTRVGITRDDVETIVGRRPDVFVPSNRDIPRAVNEGLAIVSVDPKSDAARAFKALAGYYVHDNGGLEPSEPRRRKRFQLLRKG